MSALSSKPLMLLPKKCSAKNDVPFIQDRLFDDFTSTIQSTVDGSSTDMMRWRRLVEALSGVRATVVLDLRQYSSVNLETIVSFLTRCAAMQK
jgi:hypothetical protein